MADNFKDFDQYLIEAAHANVENLALTDGESHMTWSELDACVSRIAQALLARLAGSEQKIAALSANSLEYLLVFFGALRAGATMVPLSTLASAQASIAMLEDSGAKILFVSHEYKNLFREELQAWQGCGGRKLIALDKAGLEELISIAPALHPHVDIQADQGFNLIYSSGTTGTPKGILHDRQYRSREIADMKDGFLMDSNCRTIVATPLYSNTTLFFLLAVMAAGGAAYLMPKFDADKFLKIASDFQPTHQMLVPVQYDRILNSPDFDKADLSSFQIKFSTSAPLPAVKKREILERWPAGGLVEFYGMTEGGVSFIFIAHEQPNRLESVGQPTAGCEIVILDDQGQILPSRATGEIAGWSPKMMRGYHNCREATQEALWEAPDGRYFQKSGDIGWMDDEGFLYLLDRKKDVIISGGFNVYASDLEQVLLQYPVVRDAAVVGAPSEQWGETPVAFVEPRLGPIDVVSLLQSANSTLGKGQRLSAIQVVEALPRNNIGKILKGELRDIAAQRLTA